MKKWSSIFLLLIGFFGFSQIRWMTFSEAIEAQKKEPKKIIIDFYADWCAPCKEMEKHTYNHPEIAKIINDNFYPVKFESDGNETISYLGHRFSNPDYKSKKTKNELHQFTKYMNVTMIPTMVFLDEKAQPITYLSGFLKAKEVEPYFSMIGSNEYKSIKNKQQWDNYQKKFRSKIKD